MGDVPDWFGEAYCSLRSLKRLRSRDRLRSYRLRLITLIRSFNDYYLTFID